MKHWKPYIVASSFLECFSGHIWSSVFLFSVCMKPPVQICPAALVTKWHKCAKKHASSFSDKSVLSMKLKMAPTASQHC